MWDGVGFSGMVFEIINIIIVNNCWIWFIGLCEGLFMKLYEFCEDVFFFVILR